MARMMQGAGVLIAMVVLAACSGGEVGTASSPAEDVDVSTSSSAEGVEVSRPALEVVEEFFEAFNRGDIDAALGLIHDETDEIFGSYVGPDGVEFLSFGEDSGRPWLAHSMASGARMTDEVCSVDDESPTGATVSCSFESEHSYREAVGAPALESRATFDVSDGLIVRLDKEVDAFGPNVGGAYFSWMAETYPEDEQLVADLYDIYFWKSIEHAIAAGEAEARHVDEYAAYLEENGCPMTGCTTP